jgi:predicted nucleic acid-binding protein
MNGLTLDTGALIAIERGDRGMARLLAKADERRLRITVPAGVVAQAWRDGRKQARLSRLLASDLVEIEPLDDFAARLAGQLCGRARADDIVDASVIVCARRRGDAVVTSDVADLRRLDPSMELIEI